MDAPGVPLDQLLAYVAQALHGDRRLRAGLFRQFQRLAQHPTAPPEERRLGAILARLLMGDRTPDLSGLPDDMRQEIEAWLVRLDD